MTEPSRWRRLRCWVMRQLGFRGLILVGIGIYHVSFGMHLQDGIRQPIDPDHAILFESFPFTARVVSWLVLGSIIIVAGVFPKIQQVGFALAFLMPAERAVSYLWSWWHWIMPGEPGGAPDAIWMTVRWVTVIGLICVATSLPEAPERLEEIRQGGT